MILRYGVLILSIFSCSAIMSMDDIEGQEMNLDDRDSVEVTEIADFIINSFRAKREEDKKNPIKPFLINNLEDLQKSDARKYKFLKKLINATNDTSRSANNNIKHSTKTHQIAGELFTAAYSEYLDSTRSEYSSNVTLTKIGVGALGLQCCVVLLYLAGALPPLLSNC